MSTEYHKIQTVYLRNPDDNFKTLLEGEFALPEFKYLALNRWVFTEKVDGTNIRVMFDGNNITFGGKTDTADMPPFLRKRLEEIFYPQLDTFREKFPDGVCLYGEGYGTRIQKGGGKYRPDADFVLFDVNIADWWLERHNIVDVAATFRISVVPVIGNGTLYDMVEKTRNGFKSLWGDFQAEGIVARPFVELKNRAGHRIITKIKTRDFRKEQ